MATNPTAASDPHDLQRFVEAQAPVYAQVAAELRAGAKRSHWMWFVFPQKRGLGRSAMAERYAIASRAEAIAYLQHSLLGRRLRECTRLVLAVQGRTARQIFGTPDDLKLESSLRLFASIGEPASDFEAALRKYFGDAALDPDDGASTFS